MYKTFISDGNAWTTTTEYKFFVLDRNTWYHYTRNGSAYKGPIYESNRSVSKIICIK